jgi:hypothetical protein
MVKNARFGIVAAACLVGAYRQSNITAIAKEQSGRNSNEAST